MLDELSPPERMRLLRFICSFAWADLEVQQEERHFVSRLVGRLGLEPEEQAQVEEWLKLPPPIDQVDPTDIPAEHRKLFLQTVRELVEVDGQISSQERESFEVLRDLLGV